MKIKHWQGYGSVNYYVVKKTSKELIVDVYGDHEWGLQNDYSAKEWLFDRIMKKYSNIREDNLIISSYSYYNNGEERCMYQFSPKFGLTFEKLSASTN